MVEDKILSLTDVDRALGEFVYAVYANELPEIRNELGRRLLESRVLAYKNGVSCCQEIDRRIQDEAVHLLPVLEKGNLIRSQKAYLREMDVKPDLWILNEYFWESVLDWRDKNLS
jgi:hypothetical protein